MTENKVNFYAFGSGDNFTRFHCLFLAGNLSIILKKLIRLKQQMLIQREFVYCCWILRKKADVGGFVPRNMKPLLCCKATVGQFFGKIFRMNLMLLWKL